MTSFDVALRPVIADRMPRVAARGALLVLSGALLTAALAQVVVPLPFTPVPISGQTLAVLLVGVVLGPARGSASMLLYLLMGAVGLPFYAQGSSGVTVLAGATGGYLAGFVVAAWLVGALARRGLDRKPWTMALVFAAGSVVVYSLGVPWLAVVADVSLGEAVRMGVAPFLVGDLIKAALAGAVLPTAWRVLGDDRGGDA